MSIEAKWRQTLKDTEVPPLPELWIGILIGGLMGALIVGGIIFLLSRSLFWAISGGLGACGLGFLCLILDRNQRTKRRQSLVEMLMAKVHHDMETKEFVAVLSALGDLGPSAKVALPLIEKIQHANSSFPVIHDACMTARSRITGTDPDGGANPASLCDSGH